MKYLIILITLLFSVLPAHAKRPPVARVDAQFVYGFDVAWLKNPNQMKHVQFVSIEWEGGQYFAQVTSFKVGYGGTFGIIYVVPAGIVVPPGALVTIVK